ncbi:hypothetical protein BH11ARM2_BH11ARM2_09970 [soil metagenome]
MLDTGSARTILDPRTIEIIGGPAKGKVTLTGVGGVFQATEHSILGVRIGDLAMPLQEVVAWRLPSNATIDGLLELDALRFLRLDLDLAAGVVVLTSSNGGE